MVKPRSARFVSLNDSGATEKLLFGLRPLSSQTQQESIKQDEEEEGKRFVISFLCSKFQDKNQECEERTLCHA